jgi:hypothetical protein
MSVFHVQVVFAALLPKQFLHLLLGFPQKLLRAAVPS